MNIAKLKKAAKIGAFVVLTVVVAVILIFVWTLVTAHQDDQAAEAQAKEFCTNVARGDVAALAARAEQAGIRYWYDEHNAVYEFQFPGFMLNAAHCEVRAQDGRVVSTRTFFVHD